jgi:hypothetical protein
MNARGEDSGYTYLSSSEKLGITLGEPKILSEGEVKREVKRDREVKRGQERGQITEFTIWTRQSLLVFRRF